MKEKLSTFGLWLNFLAIYFILSYFSIDGQAVSKHFVCTCVLVGARVDVKNNENKTALDLAKNPECAALIQRAGEVFE